MLFKQKVQNQEHKVALGKMSEQLKEKGGRLSFSMKIDEEGWFATCKEFPGIITGGSNKNPTEEEIFRAVIDSVQTAFHVPITSLKKEARPKSTLSVSVEREYSLHNYAV